jgi:polyferredoxin
MNLRGRWFCNHLCPLGIIQDVADKQVTKKLKVPRIFLHLRWVTLVVVAGLIIITQIPAYQKKLLPYEPFYWYSTVALIIFFAVLTLSYFVPRVFCNYMCPWGALADTTLWFKKRIWRKKYK